ncbi:MAG: hypothetical protein HY722_01725, partial [Planctomycetes bacterium]|nr:hypothetical protein [Planctomycetota bacterium]
MGHPAARAVLLVVLLVPAPTLAATVTWTNGGATNLWSTATNWDTGSVPGAADDVLFNATSVADCNIDTLPTVPASITLASNYTGSVTAKTGFRGDRTLALTGDLVVNGGAFVGEAQDLTGNGLGVIVTAANLTVASGASLHADGKGFAGSAGPGAGGTGARAAGGGHGGKGGDHHRTPATGGAPYGSATAPTSLGSGGGDDTNIVGEQGGAGGGAIT